MTDGLLRFPVSPRPFRPTQAPRCCPRGPRVLLELDSNADVRGIHDLRRQVETADRQRRPGGAWGASLEGSWVSFYNPVAMNDGRITSFSFMTRLDNVAQIQGTRASVFWGVCILRPWTPSMTLDSIQMRWAYSLVLLLLEGIWLRFAC
jgi:hypothetical protein